MLIPELLHSIQPDGSLDVVTPDGKLHPVPADGKLTIVPDPKLAAWIQTMEAAGVDLPMMAMMNNSDGKTLSDQELAPMLTNPAARERLIQTAVQYAVAQHHPGIVLDFESIPDSSQEDFTRFVKEFGAALHKSNLKLMVALPAADWIYDYKSIADALRRHHPDELRPALADFRRPGLSPPQDWFVRNMENILKLVPADKIVMGIANYGYDWPAKTKKDPHPAAQALTFQQAIITAVESESDVDFDADSLNPHLFL